MSRIDPHLNEVMTERLDKINRRIREMLIYFQEHEPILADSPREYVDLVNRICLSLYATNCQLEMTIMYLAGDK